MSGCQNPERLWRDTGRTRCAMLLLQATTQRRMYAVLRIEQDWLIRPWMADQ